jgi:hypothetical protein
MHNEVMESWTFSIVLLMYILLLVCASLDAACILVHHTIITSSLILPGVHTHVTHHQTKPPTEGTALLQLATQISTAIIQMQHLGPLPDSPSRASKNKSILGVGVLGRSQTIAA